MEKKTMQLEELGIYVGMPSNGRRHYHYDGERALPLESIADAIYTDIGWNLAKIDAIGKADVIPVVVDDKRFYLYDEGFAGHYLHEKPSADAVRRVADYLKVDELTGYYGCPDEEFEKHSYGPLRIRLFDGSSAVVKPIAELYEEPNDDCGSQFYVDYLHADSSSMIGAQEVVKALLFREIEE